MQVGSLQLPGTLESLDLLSGLVRDTGEKFHLPESSIHKLLLAADEFFTNTVTYGFGRSGLSGPVDAALFLENGKLTLVMEDGSPPFNPKEHPQPQDLLASLEAREIGGLGIYLALKHLDVFDYEWRDGKNILSLSMTVPAQLPSLSS